MDRRPRHLVVGEGARVVGLRPVSFRLGLNPLVQERLGILALVTKIGHPNPMIEAGHLSGNIL